MTIELNGVMQPAETAIESRTLYTTRVFSGIWRNFQEFGGILRNFVDFSRILRKKLFVFQEFSGMF